MFVLFYCSIWTKEGEAEREDCVNNNTSKDTNGGLAAITATVTSICGRIVTSGNGISLPMCLSSPISPDTLTLYPLPSSGSSSSSGSSTERCNTPACPVTTAPCSKFGSGETSKTDSQEPKSAETVVCRWAKCFLELKDCNLMEHIRHRHVETQHNSEVFVCLWDGCKVYNKPSCSQSWLERHMLSHSGDKPFRCIVDGCGMRFTSQGGLERHVNSHFNTYQPVQPQRPRSKEDTPSKAVKKRKLKRKRSWLSEYHIFIKFYHPYCITDKLY